MPLKALFLIAGTAVCLIVGYYFSIYAACGFNPDFLAINACTESGGRWNYESRSCEKIPGTLLDPKPSVIIEHP